jgi:hypothetical protein
MSRQTGSCKNAMQDCRAFTDYSPNCALNEYIKTQNGANNSTEYRLFLQRNACSIMGQLKNRSESENPTGCKCDSQNSQHPPHDYAHDRLFSKQISPSEAYQRNMDINRPLNASGGCGSWTQYC